MIFFFDRISFRCCHLQHFIKYFKHFAVTFEIGDQHFAIITGHTAPAVKKEFDKTEYAKRLAATGVVLSCICPLMYMNNPLAGKMPVITCSNKLRTYTTARFYTEDEILVKITKGGK